MSWQLIVVVLTLVALHARLSASHPDVPHLERKENGEDEKTQVKRLFVWHVLNLNAMVKCATGRRGTDYNGYGCWCGLGGRGRPVDGTDRCCQIHDRCYDRIIASGICGFPKRWSIYFKKYKKTGCLSCARESQQPGWWTNKRQKCKYSKCRCDAEWAKCLRRNRFNSSFRKYNNQRCKN